MNLPLCFLMLCVGAATVASGRASAENFSFVAIGDAPYRVPAQLADFSRLTERINRTKPAFTIHVGDINSGTTRCDDPLYERMLEMFNAFDQPLIYTPGDNEWTDCHRASNGSYDPVERLGKLRSTFFGQPGSLGRKRIAIERQSAQPPFAKFVENGRWERSGVHFATVHIVGSNNNLQRDQDAVNEYVERNKANLAWIDQVFRLAVERQAKAVVIAFQADPRWELDGQEDRRSGFSDTVRAFKAGAIAFGGPVLLIHGDLHRFIIDKPLYQNRKLVYNATRLMVFGDTEVQGVVINVDTEDPDVFSFRTLTVSENIEQANRRGPD